MVRFSGCSMGTGTHQQGRRSAGPAGPAEVRQFLGGLGGEMVAVRRGAVTGVKSPLDEVQVVRNDLSVADLDLVPAGSSRKNHGIFEFFSRSGEKMQVLAEHKMLRGAVGQLNSMLTATRSFFW